MNEDTKRGLLILFGGFSLGFMFTTILIYIILKRECAPYYQGQIDALNGKIHYEKITNENNEVVWKRKK